MPTLRLNDTGASVKILQYVLRKLDYPAPFTGTFDKATRHEVRRFQFKHLLFPDGVVGAKSWAKMLQDTAVTKIEVRGIDIARYENLDIKPFNFIPWKQVLDNGQYFCFIKGTDGETSIDPYFFQNFNELKKEPIARGAYHFMKLIDGEIDAQIQNFLSLGIDYKAPGCLPPVLDVEEDGRLYNETRAKENRALIVARMKTWLEAVEKATGEKPIIYTRKSFWEEILNSPKDFDQYPLWFAYYPKDANDKSKMKRPDTWGDKWHIWQYTEEGKLLGIKGTYDFNRFNGNLGALWEWVGY
jgi:lysozyme